MIAHIIHNPLSVDRWARLEPELRRQKINYIVHDAVIHDNRATGCSRAHKSVIEYAIRNGLKKIWVMEDDCYFPHPLGAKYYLLNEPKHECDIYLGGTNCQYPILDGNRVVNFCGTHCYIAHEKFYDTILKADESQNIDLWLHRKGQYYVCYPFAAIQYDGWSEINQANRTWESSLRGREIFGINYFG